MAEKENARTMTSEELSSFCDRIALMLDSGMTLADGLEMLAEDDPVYQGLLQTVEETGSLYDALRESKYKWPQYMVEMVGIGEETGRLEDIMRNLSDFYRREGRIRSAAVSAVTYPAVLGAMLVVIIMVLLWRVLPVFRRVLESLGVGNTGVGAALMNIGAVIGWVVLAMIAIVVVFALVCVILMKTDARDKVLSFLQKLFPPARRIVSRLSSARVAGMLSLMLSSGFPMENALEMAPAALTDSESIARVELIRKKMSEDNMTFSEALNESHLFADFHNRMIKVGAASGHEPQVMAKISDLYEEKVEDSLSQLISIIEPTLVAMLSIVIGAILLSVMLPMAGILGSL